MIAIDYISKTDNYYIAGLVLSFPGLSIIAYYFMYMEQGASKVRVTTRFAMLSSIPFAIFLVALNFALKKYNIYISILIAAIIWSVISSALIVIWKSIN